MFRRRRRGSAQPGAGSDRPLGPRYVRLWTASAVSNLGDGIDATALPLVAATLTRDPLLFSGLAVAMRLPWLLFALQAGALADRLDRKRLMGYVNLVRAVLVAGLATAVLLDAASIWLLYTIGFALGMAETLFDNASQAILPALVPRTALERANGRLFAAEITANQFVGPPLGGLLFAVAAALPIFVDAGTFLVSGLLVLSISGVYVAARPQDRPRPPMRTEIAEGVRWLWNHRVLRALGLMLGLSNMLGMMIFAIFPLFVLEVVGLGPVGLGVLFAVNAVGSVIGSLLAGRIVNRFGRARTLIAAAVVFAVAPVAQGATSSAVVVGASGALFSFGAIVWNVITVSLRQTIIPDGLLGRVNAVYRFLGWGAMPIGSLLGGLLAASFGLRAPFFVAGAIQLLALAPFLRAVNTRTLETARTAAPD